jgi:hypothetical protein
MSTSALIRLGQVRTQERSALAAPMVIQELRMLTAAAVVLCAFDILGRSPSATVPIKFLGAPPPGVSSGAEALAARDPPTVYLIMSSMAFRDAQRGRGAAGHADGCKKLASAIVHEEWHVRNGSDEEGAYIAQIRALLQMRARPEMLTEVRRSMAAVLRAQRTGDRSGALAPIGGRGEPGAVADAGRVAPPRGR